jgi:hypothetical protein
MQFENDILISYAHIDDAPLIEGQKGWISEFHRSLELRLAQLLGKKPKIWRDPKLQGNDHFADEILSQLPRIALLISVVSPRYVRSEWCVREVSTFHEVASKNIGVRINNKSRIFKIIKTPVKRDDHPPVMRDLLGYEFYKLDPETGRAKELNKIFGEDNEQAYWQTLDDLAHDIRELLETLYADNKETGNEEPSGKKSVYLAETTSDLKEHREAVRRELQQHGYRIVPDQSLPLVVRDLYDTTKALLEKSILSVHLIGSNYGIIPEGAQKSIIELQNELAAERSQQANLQRLIWMAPVTKTEDIRQNTFIQSLKTDTTAQAGADLLITSLEEAKAAILDKLTKAQKKDERAPVPVVREEEATPRIYLICDHSDLETEAIRQVEDHLFRQGFEITLPVFEGDETQVRLEHQESLKTCTGVMIFFGTGNELWLRSKLRDLMKIAGYGRTTPLTAKAVYLAPPSSPQKERFRSHDVTVVNGLTGFTPSSLDDFMNDARPGVNRT